MGNGQSTGGQGSDQREETVESSGTAMKAACAVGAVAATGVALIYGLSSAAQSDNKEMMKAPGGNGELIAREPFEKDPKGYFQELRRKGK